MEYRVEKIGVCLLSTSLGLVHCKLSLGEDAKDVLELKERFDVVVAVPAGEPQPPKLDMVDTELHLSTASLLGFLLGASQEVLRRSAVGMLWMNANSSSNRDASVPQISLFPMHELSGLREGDVLLASRADALMSSPRACASKLHTT
jgi:hypothetical protein